MKNLNKKSIYIDEKLHIELKTLAILGHCSMIELIEKFLEIGIRKELDDLKTKDLVKLASLSKSFAFLKNQKEDIYSDSDGEKL